MNGGKGNYGEGSRVSGSSKQCLFSLAGTSFPLSSALGSTVVRFSGEVQKKRKKAFLWAQEGCRGGQESL